MERIKEGLTNAGIPCVSECMGGNIEGVRIGSMYILEHGSGEGYYFGTLDDESDTCHTYDEVIRLAKHKEVEWKMEEKIKEVFDLEWIKNFVEKNIDHTEWIEEEYGETRKILLIGTLVSSQHGAYIPGMVLELFGQAEGYDLENPYNWEKNETIHDTLMFWENRISDCLNELLPSKGYYYVGYLEHDGSYCLFYEEYEEETEQD